MLENRVTDKLEYKKLSPEEQQKRGILGRLVGIIADGRNATRNGRKYSEKLWENVFKDPIMKERIETNCCFGELGHPTDREETDMEKIAICMDGLPKKDSNGKLQAIFNILDTPNGRILKTLCDYGCKIGVSSRGSGEVSTNFDGTEDVDPDSYECQGFDAVIIPAVKEARLNYVTEELNKTRYNKTLKARLQESYNKASADDKKIMKETFDNIGVSFKEPYPVEFTYTEETDESYTNYFGHLNVVADSEKEALDKAERYVNSIKYQNDHMNQHSFRNFHIGDTAYTNVDLVEDFEPIVKYYAIIGYEPGDGETGPSGDKFFIDSEVVAASSEDEAREKLNADSDANIQEVTRDDYEEYLEWSKQESLNEAAQTSQYNLYSGAEFTSKSGHKIWIDDVHSSFSPYDGSPYISVNYHYKMVDGKEGESRCSTHDLFNMLKEELQPLSEAKFGPYNYVYGVHVIGHDGRDRTLGGADTLEAAEKIGINQAKHVMENPWMTDAEKMRYFENMYISNDDKEIEVDTIDFENYLDNMMSELDSRIKASKANMNESKFIQPKYHDGDVVFIGDADGYQGTFLINGDISKLPEKLYSNIRRVMKYGNTDDPFYSVEYKLPDDSHQFEEDYSKFFDYVEKLLSANNIKLVKNIKDESLDINKEDGDVAVDNNKAIVDQLQELLEHNRDLESQVMSLQEKLSVCYAKDSLKEEKMNSYKNAIKTLTEDNKKLNALVEKFNTTKEKLDDSSKNIKTLESLLKTSLESKKALKERLSEKSSEISTLKEQLEAATKVKETLNENYNVSQKERDLLKKDYEEKLNNSKQLIEKYKAVAKNAVNKYINSQAVRIGVKPEEIKNKLPESYGFSDIDSICEDLKKYKISVGRLPFNAELLRENKVKMTATPSKNDPLTGLGNIDDDVDSQLLSLAKIN